MHLTRSEPSKEEFAGDVAAAVGGDRPALERVVRGIEPMVSRLALRFFGCPEHARDATQEALVQLVTRLDRFDQQSSFTTWAYRVATNKFLSMARSRAEQHALSFEAFEEDLLAPAGPLTEPPPDVDDAMLTAEVRVGCTVAMLLCLDRDARMAYILGAIVELDHAEAAEILQCSTAAYRKRLERARESITGLMRRRCGVFDAANPCRCGSRVGVAMRKGRIDPSHLVFANSAEQVREFPGVLVHIRRLEELTRAAAIYRSHPDLGSREDFSRRLLAVLEPSNESAS